MPLNANSPNIIRRRDAPGWVKVHICPDDYDAEVVWAIGLNNALTQSEKHPGLKPAIVQYIASRCGTGRS